MSDVARNQRAVIRLIEFLVQESAIPGDWRELVEVAGETLTIGLLADRALARIAELQLPAVVSDLFEDVRERTRRRNKLLKEQFLELSATLNEIDVQAIPMKGLARLLSGSSSDCRLLADIDLLVPPDRRTECVAAMAGLGYTVLDEAGERIPIVLARARDAGSVDLHTEIKPYYMRLGYDRVASLCDQITVAGKPFLLPSPTCQALILIAHDQLLDADYWRGLIDVRHLIDLHEIIKEGVDWAALADFFDTGSSRHAFEVGLLTASSLTRAEIPASYRGGRWARVQLARRRLQARIPSLRPLLTLLTITVDPPPTSGPINAENRSTSWSKKLHRRLGYLRPLNPGKASLSPPPKRTSRIDR